MNPELNERTEPFGQVKVSRFAVIFSVPPPTERLFGVKHCSSLFPSPYVLWYGFHVEVSSPAPLNSSDQCNVVHPAGATGTGIVVVVLGATVVVVLGATVVVVVLGATVVVVVLGATVVVVVLGATVVVVLGATVVVVVLGATVVVVVLGATVVVVVLGTETDSL
jgi:hypothetical protein